MGVEMIFGIPLRPPVSLLTGSERRRADHRVVLEDYQGQA